MKEPSEESRKEMHDVRNMLGHLQLELKNVDERISEGLRSIEQKMERLESKLVVNSFKIGDQQEQIENCRKKHTDSPNNKSGE